MFDRPEVGRARSSVYRSALSGRGRRPLGSALGLKAGHENNARAVDKPIAALLTDLKGRGLLESTLVVWGGEFGRTPMAQGSDGRDHNPYGFTMWMAGGGIKGGQSMALPTTTAITPLKTRSRSMTCTPRFFI